MAARWLLVQVTAAREVFEIRGERVESAHPGFQRRGGLLAGACVEDGGHDLVGATGEIVLRGTDRGVELGGQFVDGQAPRVGLDAQVLQRAPGPGAGGDIAAGRVALAGVLGEVTLHPGDPLDLSVGVFGEITEIAELSHGGPPPRRDVGADANVTLPGGAAILGGVTVKGYTVAVTVALRPMLADGERLLLASPLVADPGATEDVDVGDEVANLLDPTILLGLGTHPGNLVQRAVFGRAVTGGPNSLARRLFDAVGSVTSPTLVVTDRRLLIVEISYVPRGTGWWRHWFGPADPVAAEVHAVAMSDVVGAVAAPAGVLRKGRFLVGFADRSGCVLVCATPGLGARAVETITGCVREDDQAGGKG